VSSSCGSADVLEALGVNLNLTPQQVGRSVDQIGIGFMFAPNFHGAMKYAAPVRRELGVRTMFNVLGPLTNPAGANNQVLGVFHPDLVGIQARVLQRLGSNHVLVVNGSDGLDEITISGPSHIAELINGQVNEYSITPEEFGFQSATLDSIRVGNVEEAKEMLLGVLDNRSGTARDIVLLNAGAAIYVAGLAGSLADGIKKAAEVLANGMAKNKLAELVKISKLE
jgi:anthranilate phosphoribosyltransferase